MRAGKDSRGYGRQVRTGDKQGQGTGGYKKNIRSDVKYVRARDGKSWYQGASIPCVAVRKQPYWVSEGEGEQGGAQDLGCQMPDEERSW